MKALPREESPGGCATGECLPTDPARAQAVTPAPALARESNPVAVSLVPVGEVAPAAVQVAPPALPLGQRWKAAVDAVRAVSPRHGASLAFARLLDIGIGEIRLGYGPQGSFHRATVSGASGRATIEKALSEHFGSPMRLKLEEADATVGFCLADEEARAKTARTQGVEQRVREHPAVRSVLLHLGGQVEHIQLTDEVSDRPSDA